MSCKKSIIFIKYGLFIFFLFPILDLFAQQIHSVTLNWSNPSKDGYEFEVTFKYKFINCYGDIHLAITSDTKTVVASAYYYKGKKYYPSDLGLTTFGKINIGLTDLSTDVYDASYKLGTIPLKNVIDWGIGGCFGQTYTVIRDLGLRDSDFRAKLSSLKLYKIRITFSSTTDYILSKKISELEKRKTN